MNEERDELTRLLATGKRGKYKKDQYFYRLRRV
jgi:hypothetical protein